VLEGPHALEQAVAAGAALEAVFVDAAAGGAGPTVPSGVDVHHVTAEVLRKVTDVVTSQGVAAIVRRPEHRLADVDRGVAVLVLVTIGDPGNAGTLVRSAEAAGMGAVLFTAGSVDPWSPKAVRASAGSVLRVPVISGGEAGAVLDEVHATGRRCVGTRATDAPDYTDVGLGDDVALVLGNEAHGLPAGLAPMLDAWVRIPMVGAVESLNVAMAGTLLCYEVARGRDRA
jgi:RNA methyltransferase, TrmH family